MKKLSEPKKVKTVGHLKQVHKKCFAKGVNVKKIKYWKKKEWKKEGGATEGDKKKANLEIIKLSEPKKLITLQDLNQSHKICFVEGEKRKRKIEDKRPKKTYDVKIVEREENHIITKLSKPKKVKTVEELKHCHKKCFAEGMKVKRKRPPSKRRKIEDEQRELEKMEQERKEQERKEAWKNKPKRVISKKELEDDINKLSEPKKLWTMDDLCLTHKKCCDEDEKVDKKQEKVKKD